MYVSKVISALVTKLIQDFISESVPDPLNLQRLAAEEMVLPLSVDMGGVVALSANGDIVSFPFGINASGNIVAFPFDGDEPPRVESDRRIRNIALFQGSKKYPELKGLISKPDNARVCPYCGGTGVEPYAAKLNTDNIVCYCGGLGWIP